ncbi:MAG: L,D-transpeptidase [Erysipelotrichaceae bacterium]|nr:L,D-transpeptidase [Erysipelotrichaceae bacterium]
MLKLKKSLKVKVIAVIGVILTLLTVYLGGIIFYSSHFLPKTSIEGINVSGQSISKVNEAFKEIHPTLTVKQKNKDGINYEDQKLDLRNISDDIVYDVSDSIRKQNTLLWFVPKQDDELEATKISGTLDKNKLSELINTLYCLKEENIVKPVDAHVDIVNNQAAIVKENDGSYIKADIASGKVETAIEELFNGRDTAVVDLLEYYEKAQILEDDPSLETKKKALENVISKTITIDLDYYDETLSGSSLTSLLEVKDSQATINEDKLDDYVMDLSYDNPSLNRAELKSDLIKVLLSNKNETVYATFEEAGETLIEVVITEQTLYYYEDGVIILTSPVVTGNPAITDETPHGNFEVTKKVTDTQLMGRDYIEHVDYWIGFDETGRVYGFHDASWRDEFGGDIYTYDPSRGCVNMPTDKVARLFDLVELGTPVYIHE